MFRVSYKQWEVAILISINTSAPIKFRIVEMDNWLNLDKCPCWDSIHDPFASEANPWTAGLRYLSSFEEGIVPSQWKKGIVVRVPKQNPPSLDNLRPISLTSIFAKVAEGFV